MKKFNLILIFCSIGLLGCKKLIEVDLPIDKNTGELVYSSSETAISVMTGIYAALANNSEFTRIGINSGLLADELISRNNINSDYQRNAQTGSNGFIWRDGYRDILFRINSLIEGINNSKTIKSAVKTKLLGEAKFTRAWVYFYLTNFYGDVPLITGTDYKVNGSIGRTNQLAVYKQMEEDLLSAQNDLSDAYLDKYLLSPSNERIRPNKTAATALLARVYLYQRKWQNAELEASKVISNPNYKLLENLNEVFLKNSMETIFALQPNPLDNGGTNTPEGKDFVRVVSDPFYELNPNMLGVFEVGDKRQSSWLLTLPSGLTAINKYKIGKGNADQPQAEYSIVLRLSEMYLVRSEARVHLGLIEPAKEDLNAIRSRAGLEKVNIDNTDLLLSAILHERQTELFTEWGHRWFDLKRFNVIDEVMALEAPKKGGSWMSFKALLPIPFNEFQFNTVIRGHQNPGYSETP